MDQAAPIITCQMNGPLGNFLVAKGSVHLLLQILRRHIFQYILYPALQYAAQRVQRLRRYRLSVLHAMQRIGRHAVFED